MAARYQLKPRRPGYQCYADGCEQLAVWKGVVAGWFLAGRACNDHRSLLETVAKDMARDWQPCPCPDACGR